jgi:hypothetical protein
MASRKKVAKRRSQKTPKNQILIKLSRRAMREAKALLKRSEAGPITKANLSSALKQLEVPLQLMVGYISTTLKDVSKLRTGAGAGNKAKLKIELKEVGKKVNRMLDHGGPGDHRHHH